MTQLLIVILHKPTQLPGLLEEWQKLGVPGLTIVDGAGGHRARGWLKQVGLSAVNEIFFSGEAQSKILISAMEDETLLKQAIAVAEDVVGGFNDPDKGVLFVLPISYAQGITKNLEEVRKMKKSQSKMSALASEAGQITRNTPVSKINEILSLKPVIVFEDQPLLEVAEAMVAEPNVNVASVVNKDGRLMGLIPLMNLVDDLIMEVMPEEFLSEVTSTEEAMRYAKLSQTQTAGDAMIEPVWVRNDDTVKVAFKKIHDSKLSGVPVIDERHQVTGYINQLEILALYARGQKSSQEVEGDSNA